MFQASGGSCELTEEEGKCASSLSPPHGTTGSSHSSGGESDVSSNGSNEKSEISSSSCLTQSGMSSLKESDDMWLPDNDSGTFGINLDMTACKDKVFVPVEKSAVPRGRAPFWLESLAVHGEHSPDWLYRGQNTIRAGLQGDFVRTMMPQPEGIFQQLDELVSELKSDEGSPIEEDDYKKLDYTVEEKALLAAAVKATESSSFAGDSGFKSSGKSMDGGNSTKKSSSTCSNVSPSDSGTDEKGSVEQDSGKAIII